VCFSRSVRSSSLWLCGIYSKSTLPFPGGARWALRKIRSSSLRLCAIYSKSTLPSPGGARWALRKVRSSSLWLCGIYSKSTLPSPGGARWALRKVRSSSLRLYGIYGGFLFHFSHNGASEMIKEIVTNIKTDDLDILFRMDSGYFDEEMSCLRS